METKIIFGPPGTGKTTKLLSILSEELKQYNKDEIAFVSYTREGVNQGKSRAISEFGGSQKDYPYFRTLHSLAFYELHMKPVDMITKKHYRDFSKKMGMSFTGYYTEDLRHNDDKYLFVYDLHRNNPKTTKHYIDELDIQKYNFVKNNYIKFKQHLNVFDFTDIVENFVKQDIITPVKVAIIDEAQDLSNLQWKMIWSAFKHVDKLYIAGDDDQAIYQWSGADVDYFLGLEGEIEILDKSYRLPDSILSLSKKITKQISKRINKEYSSTGKEGDVVYINNIKELNITKNESWLFLSRNNIYLKSIESFLQSKGLPYKVKGSPRITEEELNIIRLYEKVRKTKIMSNNEEIKLRVHLKKNYNLSNNWYDSLNWDNDKLLHYRDYFRNRIDPSEYKIAVNTIHAIKGSEADNVVLLLDISKSVNTNLNNNPDSEHRVFYVGATRARQKLYIVYSNSSYTYNIY